MTEREKLEQAIAAQESLRNILGDAVVEATIAALKKQLEILEPRPSVEQQRKYVTVLFADVSGFTAMSEMLDAEEVTEIMNALWQRLDAAITEHGGHIDKHIGDAVMALWGVEMAHEDDPEQAINAALAMQMAIQAFVKQRQEVSLHIRIGLNTGPVLLGDVGSTHEFTAMGDTVNLASRLEHAAPVGGILISHNTYRHVRGVFDVVPQEPIIVKGKKEPVQTYIVTRKKPRAFRLRTRGVEGIETRMIGRDAEFHHLQDAFYTVLEDREMQMVTISGEAGIGKSRLLYEFDDWLELQAEEFRYFKGRCSEQTSNLPYFLIRDLFVFRFQIVESDPLEVVHEKLEQGIAEFMGAGHEEHAHFLGHLIGYSFAESPYLRGILDDPKQIRNIAFHYLTQFFMAVTGEKPAVILLEDLHWADDGSLEVIHHLMQECRKLPLLLICCARPPLFERRPLWGEGQEIHTRLDIHPLSKRDSRRLVREILQNVAKIPTELRDLIVNSAEGNPFYVEELVKMLLEEGIILKEDEEWRVATERLADLKVPPTLTGVLQARLDSLPETEQDILKRASVIGRIFWDNAVETLRISDHELSQTSSIHETLQTLRTRELIFGREASSFEDAHEYIFKHAILRDVTYERVLLRQRRELHAQAAAWLIEKSGAQVEHYAGLIGEHYEKAQQPAKAVEWYGRAGKQAQDAYAPETAIDYYQRTLKLLDDEQISEVLNTAEVYAQRIKLYQGLGEMLYIRTRYEEANEAFIAMRTAAEAIGDSPAQARAWNRLAWTQGALQGDSQTSLESAQRAEAIARTVGVAGQTELLTALNRKGLAFWRIGDAERALALAEETLARSTELDAKQEMIHSLSLFGIVNTGLGRYAQAVSYKEKAIAVCQELGNRQLEAQNLNSLAETARMRGDYQSALTGYLEALTIACTVGDRDGKICFLSNMGGTKVELGEYAAAEADLRQVIEMAGNTRTFLLSETNYFLTRACLRQGKVEEALAAAQQALALAQEFEDLFSLGSAWRVLGQVAAVVSSVHIGEADYTAADCFAESLRIFKASQMKVEQAHTLKAWAEYELKQGDRAKGETLWQEARTLFEKLGVPRLVEQMDAEKETL